MKNQIKLFIFIFLLTGCSGFLDEEPKSEINVEDFFSHPSHAYNAVNVLYKSGCANFYAAGVYAGSRAMLGGYLSGLFDNDYKGQEVQVQHCQDLTLNGLNLAGYFDGIWDDCYNAISKANLAINNIDKTPGLTANEKNKLIAEAKFFRAFNYYYLVKNFGDVPLILENYSSLNNLYWDRTPSAKIYEQIIQDLKSAYEEGGLENLPMHKNEFRISKGSVGALLADVYLNVSGYPLLENKYAEAATIARELINSRQYRLIPNGDSEEKSAYNRIRKSDLEDEYLYSIEYLATIT